MGCEVACQKISQYQKAGVVYYAMPIKDVL